MLKKVTTLSIFAALIVSAAAWYFDVPALHTGADIVFSISGSLILWEGRSFFGPPLLVLSLVLAGVTVFAPLTYDQSSMYQAILSGCLAVGFLVKLVKAYRVNRAAALGEKEV